jgi:hypothetical protein
MNRVVGFLTNRYLVSAVTGLFVLGFVKRIAGR